MRTERTLLILLLAIFGFDGLGHYTLAPVSEHTVMMNATIWLEVLAAILLLAAAIRTSLKRRST
jgi:hypothetical protein